MLISQKFPLPGSFMLKYDNEEEALENGQNIADKFNTPAYVIESPDGVNTYYYVDSDDFTRAWEKLIKTYQPNKGVK